MPDPSISDRSHPDRSDLLGLPVLSGTGERLGCLDAIQFDEAGAPRRLQLREEPSGRLRLVPVRFVKEIGEEGIRLAGPREGYHITRLDP